MFDLNPSNASPIYRQIVNQVRRTIAGGELLPGFQMPSVRAVAIEHAINPMTVSKAYSLLVNRARMEGIVVFDYAERYHLAIAEMAGYLKDGRMKSKEDVVVGLSTFPSTLLKLFNGQNFGKLVLQVAQG